MLTIWILKKFVCKGEWGSQDFSSLKLAHKYKSLQQQTLPKSTCYIKINQACVRDRVLKKLFDLGVAAFKYFLKKDHHHLTTMLFIAHSPQPLSS